MEDYRIFFIVVKPGLIELTKKELKDLMSIIPELESAPQTQVYGGIEIELPFEQGLKLNHLLKTATRILLRVTSFKCRDFPKLYNKMLKINWRDISLGHEPVLNITTSKSRLINTSKMKDSINKAIKKYFAGQGLKSERLERAKHFGESQIYIRVVDDLLTLSFDTTGSRLDKRSDDKLMTTIAPIRNNLAFATIFEFLQLSNLTELNFYDPMCGSGSFLKEALEMSHSNERTFHYQQIYKNTQFKQTQIRDFCFLSIAGSDLSKNAVSIAQKNIPSIEVKQSNIFDLKEFKPNTYICFNPPYDKRIKVEGGLEKLLKECLLHLSQNENIIGLSYISPLEKTLQVEGLRHIRGFKTNNGGIDVWVHHFLRD